ncbi:LPP20 family lipoprotein [Hydrogenimonas sp.]
MKRWIPFALAAAAATLMAESCPTPKVEKSADGSKNCATEAVVVQPQVRRVTLPPAESCTLSSRNTLHFQVVGQGVAPVNTVSPAQAKALAKRAAIADAYRQLGEKICGVRVEGRDLIRNMMISRSTVRTQIDAMIRNAKILDTKFKDGLCEVEMEVTVRGDEWYPRLAR